MRTRLKLMLLYSVLALCFSCGNNNNQHEGGAGSNEETSTPSAAAQKSAQGNDVQSSTADTVIKAPNPEPGEGSYTSGTGVKNGSGKTGGG